MILGVDGGSTKTVAVVYDDESGRIAGVGISGPANYTNSPREEAMKNIKNSVYEAVDDADVNIEDIGFKVFGLAGIGDSKEATAEGEEIVRSIAGEAIVVNDGYAAYKFANLNENGLVFAPGTGSVGFTMIDGKLSRFGGWGWFIGDEASASWMAKEALIYAEREKDGIIEAGIADKAETYFNLDLYEVVYKIMKGTIPKRTVAAFSPIISELAVEGNKYAISIFEEASNYIADLINAKSGIFSGKAIFSVLGGTMLAGRFYWDMIKKKTMVPVNIHFGYQVVIGDIIIGLEKKRTVDFNERDKLIRMLNDKISEKRDKMKEFLFMDKIPDSIP
ncbi:hypothetical protein [Thermoplasma volcanium GSS1]|uniref:ATPase BadF/BadG/BcrA/BcrD type domain-containing protein n=1 Tax=Thermoplasma volcanium (strain ATCC 51530 / DSM 4299 / JCM 9571 / NBRC 15438 / GSS1) TaxID=273116 RepID=Q97CA3_THEVO|nr:N-acetylglucosamine kinase [Thermoplasma volcanium]BAB59341.1 hypothetical protein [Thermoplasma volcanium GSS1]